MKVSIVLLCALVCCESANILYVVPFTSTSHYIMLRPIGLELARRGHNVTVITAHKEVDPPPTYHEVVVDDMKIWDIIGGKRPNVFTMLDISAEKFHEKILWAGGLAFSEVVFNSKDFKSFIAKDNHFDLVICEQFFMESLYSLAYKYNAPLALVTTFGNCMRHNLITGNPLQLSSVIGEFLDVRDITSFWGRLRNMYFTVYEYVWWRYWYLEQHEEVKRKYLPDLPKPVPSLYEIQRNASLMLINSYFSYDTPMALLPNIVEVGGLHLSKVNETLPKDLQKILDESVHGVVYMSFGSNVRSAELDKDKKKAFLDVFSRLKQTVLWKWEDENILGKPENVVVRKWLPQRAILAHPNVKVFISHGGLIGTHEAIHNGVPIIGVPIYADQYNNLLLAQNAGYGKILNFHSINENTLEYMLGETLNNTSYKIKAAEASKRFNDRPMTALDTAMFWLEYVIRNNGAEFMKSPVRNMSWISYNMLDAFVFVIILTLVIFVVTIKVLKVLFNLSEPSHYEKRKLS